MIEIESLLRKKIERKKDGFGPGKFYRNSWSRMIQVDGGRHILINIPPSLAISFNAPGMTSSADSFFTSGGASFNT